jgi:hypothetical protein
VRKASMSSADSPKIEIELVSKETDEKRGKVLSL